MKDTLVNTPHCHLVKCLTALVVATGYHLFSIEGLGQNTLIPTQIPTQTNETFHF